MVGIAPNRGLPARALPPSKSPYCGRRARPAAVRHALLHFPRVHHLAAEWEKQCDGVATLTNDPAATRPYQ